MSESDNKKRLPSEAMELLSMLLKDMDLELKGNNPPLPPEFAMKFDWAELVKDSLQRKKDKKFKEESDLRTFNSLPYATRISMNLLGEGLEDRFGGKSHIRADYSPQERFLLKAILKANENDESFEDKKLMRNPEAEAMKMFLLKELKSRDRGIPPPPVW